MSLDLAIGLAGVIVTILVVVGMILITPRGVEPSRRRPDSLGDDAAPPMRAAEPALPGPVGLDEKREPV
jgi:hypothetical protein